MNDSTRGLVVATAVYLGAVCLFGPLTFGLLVRAVEIVVGIVGIDTPLPGIASVVAIVGAIAIALEVASEAAAVQLHGVTALHRGSPRQRLGRNSLLAVATIVAGIAIVEFAIGTFQWGIAHGQIVISGLSLVLFVGLAWTLVRAARSFRQGLQRTG